MHWACFVGMRFDHIANTYIESVQQYLNKTGIHAAWQTPTCCHLTLCYAGWLTTLQGQCTAGLVKEYAQACHKLPIGTTGELIVLGHEDKMEYLCLAVEKQSDLMVFQHDLHRFLVQHKIPCKEQTFLPHISIARIHDTRIPHALPELDGKQALAVKELKIYESIFDCRPIE